MFDDPVATVCLAFSEVLKREVHPDEKLCELGLDPLESVEVVMRIEELLPTVDLEIVDIGSEETLMDFVATRLAEPASEQGQPCG